MSLGGLGAALVLGGVLRALIDKVASVYVGLEVGLLG